MAREVRIVDVFTEAALTGNQLAVVLDGQGFSDALMQRIAREMNFSETTFILPPDDPSHAAKLRIFTPFSELPFAGHPTVGTAWVLANEGMATGLDFTLEEKVGPVRVRGQRSNGRLMFWMTHPQVDFGPTVERTRVAEALGVEKTDFVAAVECQVASTGLPFLYAALRTAEAVDLAVSDASRLRTLFGEGSAQTGIFLFAAVGEGRLYSRMFSVDVPEDPATGSASGPLGAFAVKSGLVKRAPRVSIVSEQGTRMGRRSLVHIELEYGDSQDIPTRIEVGGAVMPVLSGRLSDFP